LQAALGQANLRRISLLIRNGNYEKADKLSQKKKKKIDQSSKKGLSNAIGYYRLRGTLFLNEYKTDQARENFESGFQSFKKKDSLFSNNLKANDYELLDDLGNFYLETGNYLRASELLHLSKSLRAERFPKTNLLRYRPYLHLGRYHYLLNHYDSSEYYLDQYALYILNSNHQNVLQIDRFAESFELLAELNLTRGNYDDALFYSRKNYKYQKHHWLKMAYGKNHHNRIMSKILLARSYYRIGDILKAQKWLEKAIKHEKENSLTDGLDQARFLITQAQVFTAQNRWDEAYELYQKANTIQLDYLNKVLVLLSEYEKENTSNLLVNNFNQYFRFIGEYLSTIHDPNRLQSVLHSVMQFRMETKARILDDLRNLYLFSDKGQDEQMKTWHEQWKEARAQYASLASYQDRSSATNELMQLSKQISSLEQNMLQSDFIRNRTSDDKTSLEDIRNKIRKDEVAVEIIRIDDNTMSAQNQNKRGGYLYISMDAAGNMDFRIKEDALSMEERNFNFYQNSIRNQMADNLSHDLYWSPIAQLVNEKGAVLLSGDGIYHKLDLNSILNPVSGKYLLEEYEIKNFTTLKALVHRDQGKKSITSALLLGRPDYSGVGNMDYKTEQLTSLNRGLKNSFENGISDLPGTEEEVRSIVDQLSQAGVKYKLLIHENANEAMLKAAGSSDVMHLATHGFFMGPEVAEGNPLFRSGLLLAGVQNADNSSEEDGILTAYEAANLNLENTRLVILSACETGLGEIRNGEGVYGLQRSFELAGVQSLIMSMWKVDDRATSELMVRFYDNLLKGADVASAFRSAQLEIRKKFIHPHYWGAFKYIGN
jgi:CHAT domain-containing protein